LHPGKNMKNNHCMERIKRIQNQENQANEIAPIELSAMDAFIEKYKNKKGNLIPLLQATQNLYGYIPKEAFFKLNKDAGLELNEMYGVATFYAQFRLHPVGKNIIKVCHGTACHVQNASEVSEGILDFLEIKDGETTTNGLFTVETVACLGCCSLAPVMMIGEETYGKLTSSQAIKIIREIQRNQINP